MRLCVYNVCMSKRSLMLGTSVRQIIAPILRECPPECGIVSISSIDVSTDSSHATVYITSLMEPQVALDFLRKKEPHLQHALTKLERRKIPQLHFRLDMATEQGNRIDELLR